MKHWMLMDEWLRKRMTSNRNILGGATVFKGTRVPMLAVAKRLLQGEPRATLLSDFPWLTDEDMEMAEDYLRTEPRFDRLAADQLDALRVRKRKAK